MKANALYSENNKRHFIGTRFIAVPSPTIAALIMSSPLNVMDRFASSRCQRPTHRARQASRGQSTALDQSRVSMISRRRLRKAAEYAPSKAR